LQFYKNTNDTILIQGKMCCSMTIVYKSSSKLKLYFPIDLEIDTKAIRNSKMGITGI